MTDEVRKSHQSQLVQARTELDQLKEHESHLSTYKEEIHKFKSEADAQRLHTQQATMQAQLHVQTTQMQAQSYVHEHGQKLETELYQARQDEQATRSREKQLEQRIANMSKDLNTFMDELHAHDQAALEHQRTVRKQTKANEDLMDATSTEL